MRVMDREAFLAPLSENELREVYQIDLRKVHERLGALRNDSTQMRFSDISQYTSDGNRMTYSVSFYLDSGDPVLDREIERWLSDNKRTLREPEIRAKVAFRVR